MRASQALDAADDLALQAHRRIEHALHEAEIVHRDGKQARRHDFAVHVERHIGVHLRDGPKHGAACAEDLARRIERRDALAALGVEHDLVELGLDDAVHLAAVVARQPRLAGVADGVLLAVHERVHGAVKRVVAQKAQRIGAPDALFLGVEHAKRRLQRGDELGRFFGVHGVAQAMVRVQVRADDRVEQRVGALVSQKERVGFVARAADGGEELIVDVATEEIVRDDGRHGESPVSVF